MTYYGKKKRKKILWIVSCLLILLFGILIWYVNDYYRAEDVVTSYLQKEDTITIIEEKDYLFLDGIGEEQALIFYPGAKVEYTAYIPLLYLLAEQGVDCFLVQMPCNLAILGINKAEKIIEAKEYDNWYLGGHSLGGAMAANYAAEHTDQLAGLVLLAAYPTKSLVQSSLSIASIYGSEDKVLNREKLEEGRELLPLGFQEYCIEGGNHAWFGNYGEQEGDGTAEISKEEQQEQTVDSILTMIKNRK